MANRSTTGTEVPPQTTYCKGTLRAGRYAGRRCGNASPCMTHDIMPLAYGLQAIAPDEYPLDVYVEMARQRLKPGETITGRAKARTRNRWSVLR